MRSHRMVGGAMVLWLALCARGPGGEPVYRAEAGPPGNRWTAWYDEPAGRWVEALPLGNGRLGAMTDGFRIDLLPALPRTAWPDGSVAGLRARGGFIVDLTWSNGELNEVRITSLLGNPATIVYDGKARTIDAKRGESVVKKFE